MPDDALVQRLREAAHFDVESRTRFLTPEQVARGLERMRNAAPCSPNGPQPHINVLFAADAAVICDDCWCSMLDAFCAALGETEKEGK